MTDRVLGRGLCPTCGNQLFAGMECHRCASSNRVCEVCGKPATHEWGWDNTPMCREHWREAERRYAAAEIGANPDDLREVHAIPNSVQPGTFGPVFDAGVEEGKRQVRHATPNRAAERVALELIDARDRAETYADELAATIGAMLGVDLGEHSNLNNPWQNALDAAAGRRAT